MIGFFRRLRRRLPRRRRRLWRYVSGRRRNAGLFLFALLVLLGGGYWYLTNDERVKRQVEQYLQELTGVRVKVDRAQFNLFGEILVTNLRFPKDNRISAPFLENANVFLSHRPSSLFLRGSLEPTKIVCNGGTVRLFHDPQTGQLNYSIAGGTELRDGKAPLIPIYLRDVRLEIYALLPERSFCFLAMQMNASILPEPERQAYKIILKDEAGTVQGRGTIDVNTGNTVINAPILEVGLDKMLPKKFLDWKKQHRLTFDKPWNVTVSLGGFSTATSPARHNHLIVKLKDVSMELPPEEGGLKFVGVRGCLVFDKDGVTIQNLAGQIADSGGAGFTLSGRYDGYDPDSDFSTHLTVTDMDLPFGEDLIRLWEKKYEELDKKKDGSSAPDLIVLLNTFAKFHKKIKPAGLLDADLTIYREKQGQVIKVGGTVKLKDVSFTLPHCPIRITRISGSIKLAENTVQSMGLHGRYGLARIDLSGRIAGPMDRPDYDISVVAEDLPFTPEVRNALPQKLRKVWDELSPRGQAKITVQAQSGSESKAPVINLTIDLEGETSFEYASFPYRLEKVDGTVVFTHEHVLIRSVSGFAGDMHCRINGKVSHGKKQNDFRICLNASDLPLDERLARALSDDARKAYVSCGLSGSADVKKAVIWSENGGPVNCDISVALKNAGIRHSRFPYQIEKADGEVKITSKEVAVKRLVGGHGKTNIEIGGRISLKEGGRGTNLLIKATNLVLDPALYDALPADARRGWDLLKPTGAADITMTLREPGRTGRTTTTTATNAGATRLATDYRLVVLPRDMTITYRHFPYPLRIPSEKKLQVLSEKKQGKVIIEPGAITLKSLRCKTSKGEADIVLDGQITTGAGGTKADLSVETSAIKLDRQLLSALPQGLVQALHLRLNKPKTPKGTIGLSLKSLQIRQPARGAKDRFEWRLMGKVTFNNATMDLGMGTKQITGRIEGRMGCRGPTEKLTAEADVFLDTLMVGPRRLSNITGHLHKTAKSPTLRIDRISAQVFGGRVAGFVEVRLARPRRYGLNLSMENIDLAKFLNSEANDKKRRRDIRGLITGNIQMTAVVGDRASRRATGRLQISQAKLYKLPVFLGFLHVINLTLPGKSAFHTGQVDYYLHGDTLVFQEIYLHGSTLSMLGAGTMDMKTEKLNLTFLTGPPRKLPRLSALSEMLAGIASQLMTVRVTGKLDRPRVKSVPFRNLDATLRELYQPGSK